jgi:type VI protein secretion system component Hcp
MATKIKGYNIRFKLNSKKCAGETAGSFKITPRVRESKIKDDAGKTSRDVDGYESNFTINGTAMINEAGDDATQMDVGDIRTAVKTGAVIPFVYGGTAQGSDTESGSMIITDYSEDTDSENFMTYSLTCVVVTDLTSGTVA